MSTEAFDLSATAGHRMKCPTCDHPTMYRVSRHGFLQQKIYPLFGYYPWECRFCRVTKLLKNRGVKGKRRKHED